MKGRKKENERKKANTKNEDIINKPTSKISHFT